MKGRTVSEECGSLGDCFCVTLSALQILEVANVRCQVLEFGPREKVC